MRTFIAIVLSLSLGYYAGYKKLHWDDMFQKGCPARVRELRNDLELWQKHLDDCRELYIKYGTKNHDYTSNEDRMLNGDGKR